MVSSEPPTPHFKPLAFDFRCLERDIFQEEMLRGNISNYPADEPPHNFVFLNQIPPQFPQTKDNKPSLPNPHLLVETSSQGNIVINVLSTLSSQSHPSYRVMSGTVHRTANYCKVVLSQLCPYP